MTRRPRQQRRAWDPLALGIAPETRVICEELEDDANEEQQTAGLRTAFVEDRGGHILESRRKAVWS